MGKTIKLVEGIVRKALNDSDKIYKATSYTADVDTLEGNRQFYLTHYGTLILRYDLYSRQVIDLGGAYSASDRDAINTALDVIGHTPTERAFIKNRELQFN